MIEMLHAAEVIGELLAEPATTAGDADHAAAGPAPGARAWA